MMATASERLSESFILIYEKPYFFLRAFLIACTIQFVRLTVQHFSADAILITQPCKLGLFCANKMAPGVSEGILHKQICVKRTFHTSGFRGKRG